MQGINYCPNCGRLRNETENFCSNCGRPFFSNLNSDPNSKTSYKSSNIVWIAVFIIIVIIGVSVNSNDVQKTLSSTILNNKVSNLFIEQKTMNSIQSIKEIDKMREAIDNTIWTYTKTGSLFWVKLEFKGDKVRVYNAMPSDGKWTFEEECTYTLEEGRFMDDGRRYVAAIIKCKDMSIPPKFIITNGQLSWLGIINEGGFILGDYEWE